MSALHSRTKHLICAVVGIAISTLSIVHALQPRQESSRFDRLVIADPSVVVSPAPAQADAAALPESLRGRWSTFEAGTGKKLDITVDTRSGAPMLVQGEGIPMIPGSGNSLRAAAPETLDSLAGLLRTFIADNVSLTLTAEAELMLNREGSGQLTPNLWKVVFDRSVAGVPVAGDRWIFFVGHGNLIAFGATRWSAITSPTVPAISPESARTVLFQYMGLGEEDRAYVDDEPSLVLVPMAAAGTAIDAYAGSIGAGYKTALAWSLTVEVANEPGRWTALVDAQTGGILSFEDTIQYAHAKGGVLPLTSDGQCPTGCEQPNFPMPYADITILGNTTAASSMGEFSCQPNGNNALTTLSGPYVDVNDACGPTAEGVTCNNDLNLSVSSGSDCSVPPGSSAGNTRAARSSYYHLNRIREHAKVWLPNSNWLNLQLRDNVNINLTCNAFWNGGGSNGTVNFYRSGGGCGNTGEIAAIFLHEWGHGLDQNDGGSYDNPSEAYADVTAFVTTHQSCIGRGFHGGNCGGYGNPCTSCTGVRDQDWGKHASQTPQTPDNWPGGCPTGGSGPCGREVHCEAYLSGQTLYDLAARDLPALGLDQATAWQILDRLWFASRTGSGGNAYTCGASASNRSCAANSWYTSLRAVDDDDGNLGNGTPHAGAIFAAFDRHGIPCGTASQTTNQSFTSCPALPGPTVTATPAGGEVALSWTAVPGAASYNVLRNDQSCNWAFTLVANVTGTSYTDTGLPNGFPLYYTIQPVGSNTSCVGAVSACKTATAGGADGSFDAATRVADTCGSGGAGNGNLVYEAGEQIQFSITVGNDGITPLTGVTATVTPITAGVIMLDDTATFGSIPLNDDGVSNPPHFTALLPTNLPCGSTVSYGVTINANEGSWTESFNQPIGVVSPGSGTALSENFSGGVIPATWTVVNAGSGSTTWTAATSSASGGLFVPAMSAPGAIVDSNGAPGSQEQMDEQLISPVVDLATVTNATLVFDEYFRNRGTGLAEIGDVDVRSSLTSGLWVNVLRNQNASSGTTSNAAHRSINVTSQAAGAADVQVRFHYYNSVDDHYWMIDNIAINYVVPPTCTMNTCAPASADLSVVNSGPATALAGQDISYTVQVQNQGPDAAAAVQFDNLVPAGTTYRSVSSPASWTCSTPPLAGTGTISCSTATLAATDTASFTIVVNANACSGQGVVVTNTAEVGSAASDPVTVNDNSVVTTTLTDTGACDDGNACTGNDSCQAGGCIGSTVGGPPEVVALGFTTKTSREWSASADTAPPTTYDMVRGALGEWPVGGGATESCLASQSPATLVDIADDPAGDSGYWYLVRSRNSCGVGSYGSASDGTERVTAICP